MAIASRPIESLGRIWADGNLLRGAAGDLKASGSLRIYNGYGDQNPDPLLASALGADCPAFRHCAYVVFEDLQLEDFGNRIPALTFEVIADDKPLAVEDIVDPLVPEARSNVSLEQITGISYEGGSLLRTLGVIDYLFPTVSDSGGTNFTLNDAAYAQDTPILLPPSASAWEEGDFGGSEGASRQRASDQNSKPNAIRYYDTGRDYQIGVQRPEGRANSNGNNVLEFPGALNADSARLLVNNAAARGKWAPDRLRWRMAELDTSLVPGSIIQAPGIEGNWLVTGWEWRERAVELDLQRVLPKRPGTQSGDAGGLVLPQDLLPSLTELYAFELPWGGLGALDETTVYVAVAGGSAAWQGSALYADNAGELAPLGPSGRDQSTIGHLLSELAPSPSLLLEPHASIDVQTVHAGMIFSSVSKNAIAQGANRILVGNEILQFQNAEQLSDVDWRLTGLLRGRAGTEATAQAQHIPGTTVILLDNNLVSIAPNQLPAAQTSTVAAIGRGDEEPAVAVVANGGATKRPLIPVHPRVATLVNGNLHMCWTRRARGAWEWIDSVETPLNEEAELYRVGIGDPDNPQIQWETENSEIELPPANLASFVGSQIWVRQIGRIGHSDALHLAVIS